MNNLWPKIIPELSDQQKRIRDDFVIYWHQVLPKRFTLIEKFNHIWAFNNTKITKKIKTLEIGAGLGEHIKFENLDLQEYYTLELRKEMSNEITKRFSAVKTIVGDIQKKLNFPDKYFDRIIAVHVLEHLPDLPGALKEIKRLLKNDGYCDFVLPCEGSLAYNIARKISAERIFKKRYKMSYDWFIKLEHVNNYKEIIHEIKNLNFKIKSKIFFPIPFPFIFCNLAVGIKCYL